MIQSLLKGDVIFTNFETTIFDTHKGQKRTDGRFVSPPEAMEALKTLGSISCLWPIIIRSI